MDIQDFTKKFATQFEDESIDMQPETNFRELPTWDSLTAMCVQTMVLDDYGVTLSDPDLKNLQTVEDVYNFVANAKQ